MEYNKQNIVGNLPCRYNTYKEPEPKYRKQTGRYIKYLLPTIAVK